MFGGWRHERRALVGVGLLVVLGVAAAQTKTPRPALVVLSKDASKLMLVEPTTLEIVAQAGTGPIPHEVAVSENGKLAVATNYGPHQNGSTLSVIDLDTMKEIHRVDLGAPVGPHGVVFHDGKAWFTAEASYMIGCYDPETNRVVKWLPVGHGRTHMLLFSKDGGTIYAANIEKDQITYWKSSLDESNKDDGAGQGWVAVGKGPEGFDLSPDGKELWAANSGDGTVSVVDTASKKVVATIDVGTKHSNRLKFTLDGKLALISDLGTGELVIVDTAARKVTKRLPLGKSAEGILIDPSGTRAFVAVSGDDKIAIIDLRKLEVAQTFPAGPDPDGMAWLK
jgi:YVTN family beta-propeller protein